MSSLCMCVQESVLFGFPCAWVYEHICVKLLQCFQKIQKKFPLKTPFSLSCLRCCGTINGNKSRGGHVPLQVTCVERHAVSSASTQHVNSQQDHSQRLSFTITTMAVCLTPSLTSSMQLLLFFL